MQVSGDRNVCIGAGMCVLTAPEVFDQDDAGIVLVLAENPAGADAEAAEEAAMLCPSGAVHVTPTAT